MATPRETISSLYIATFDRSPDLGGLNFWLTQANSAIAAGTAVRDVYQNIMDGQNNSGGFSSHPVFINNYGALSDAAFVDQIYQNVLGQAGDPDGVAFWIGELNTLTRGQMIVDFVSGALDFDPANFTSLTAAQLQTATERQALLENKVAAALHFVDTLGTTTNITTTPPELDQAYLASVAVLKDVTHEAATLTAAKALVDAANASATPIDYLLNPPTADPSGVTFTVKTANTDFQTDDGANDADEGNNTSTGADTINATAAQASDAATTIDGLELSDSLNITNTTGANTADFTTTAASIENVEVISVGAGVSQLKLLSADIAGNTGGEIATLTGDASAAQKLEINGSVDLTGVSNSNIEAISITDTAGTGVAVTIDTANLSGVTRLVLDDTNVGGNNNLTLSGAGTFDFSNIALNFNSMGTNTLSITGGSASTLTLDDTDLDNVGTLTGDTTADVINTLNFTGVGAKGDLSGMTVTDIDTVTISGVASTLTLEEASLSDSQFTTITGAGDSSLIFNEGGNSQAIILTNTTVNGFTDIFVDISDNFDAVVLDAESIAGSVTLHGGGNSKIQFTETDDVTGLVVNSGDFKGLILDAGVDIIANSGLLDTGSGTIISGAGATSSSLTINTSTASLDLANHTVGSNADGVNSNINIVINGMTGNDTITGADAKSAGSTMSINLASGGSDIVRLKDGSGNVSDGMVIADAVSITGFDGANDQLNIETALANGAGIALVASNAVDANTAISIINNAFIISDFSSIAQLGNTVGTYTNGGIGNKFVIAVSNNSSQTAIYSITEEGTDLTHIDAADTVTLLGIVSHTGTFDTTDINVY